MALEDLENARESKAVQADNYLLQEKMLQEMQNIHFLRGRRSGSDSSAQC